MLPIDDIYNLTKLSQQGNDTAALNVTVLNDLREVKLVYSPEVVSYTAK